MSHGSRKGLINLTTLKSHHFWQVDSKLPSDCETILWGSMSV